MSIVIAVANQKGGVGKSTIARELSACLALRGYRTLAIDADPQGNLTKSWVDKSLYSATLAHVLAEPENGAQGLAVEPPSLADIILEAPVDNLDLVPSDIKLARFDRGPDFLTLRLKRQIEENCGEYEFVIVDCPPQLGKILTAVLYATDFVIVPCEPDSMGIDGLADLAYTLSEIKRNANSRLTVLGIVVNMFKPNRNLSGESRDAITEAAKMLAPVFDNIIHDYAKIAEAPSMKMPVVLYAPNHRACEQLNNFTDEVLDRLKVSRHKIAAVR